jgi:hypothetical protein
MDRRNVQIAAAIVGLAALAVVLAVYVMRAPAPPVSSTSTPTPTASPIPTVSTPSPTPQPTATPVAPPFSPQPGATTGSLEYPSEFIPPLTVYAISTADQRVWFSVDTPRYPLATNTPPRPSYTITGVAPGTYVVIAYRNDGQGSPGGYTRAAASCRGLQSQPPPPACNDHSLVPVIVAAGQTVSGIDVTDWAVGFTGAGQPTSSIPPRPTPR